MTTINFSSIDLLLDEVGNLKALQIQMNRQIALIDKLVDAVDQVIGHYEDEVKTLNRELHALDRTGEYCG